MAYLDIADYLIILFGNTWVFTLEKIPGVAKKKIFSVLFEWDTLQMSVKSIWSVVQFSCEDPLWDLLGITYAGMRAEGWHYHNYFMGTCLNVIFVVVCFMKLGDPNFGAYIFTIVLIDASFFYESVVAFSISSS